MRTNHMNTKRRRSVTRSLTRYVVFSILMILAYTVTALYYSWNGITIPEEITTGWYSVFGGEILLCCLIKLFKLKGETQ